MRYLQTFTETTVAGVRDPGYTSCINPAHPFRARGNHWQQTGIGWKATYNKVLLRAIPLVKVLRAP